MSRGLGNSNRKGRSAGALELVELQNEGGFRVTLLDRGAAIRSIVVPAQTGDVNVVLGYSNPSDYVDDDYFLGSTVGRYAGRIDGGRLTLGDREYQLAVGSDGHCLHGGPGGFHARRWATDKSGDSSSVRFTRFSANGEEGFPGNLEASVTYRLLDGCRLLIEYAASSDERTVVNLCSHAYFNLSGDWTSVADHIVAINADRYTPLNEFRIPTGEMRSVSETPFDLRQAAPLAERIRGKDGNDLVQGYDHDFVLNKSPGELDFCAMAYSPRTGIRLNTYTTQPALHFYTGDQLGAPFSPRAGLCFEAQNFPDAPNKPGFPSAVLEPGETYSHRTLYEFDAGWDS